MNPLRFPRLVRFLFAGLLWMTAEVMAVPPVPQTQKLLPGPVGEPGSLTAVDGNYALIGTGGYDFGTHSGGRPGVALHDRTLGANWPVRKIFAPPPTDVDVAGYGESMALDGQTVAIGSQDFIYLYDRNQDGTDRWGLVKRIDRLGSIGIGLDLDGDVLVAQAVNLSGNSVMVYRRNQGGTNQWGVVSTVPEPNPEPGGIGERGDPWGRFGEQLALSGTVFAAAGRTATDEAAIHLFREGDGPGGAAGSWGLYRSLSAGDIGLPGVQRIGRAFDWGEGQLCVPVLRDLAGTLGSWVVILTPPASPAGTWPLRYATSMSGGGEVALSYGCQVKVGATWMVAMQLFPNGTNPAVSDRRANLYRASGSAWDWENSVLVGPSPVASGSFFPGAGGPTQDQQWQILQLQSARTAASVACDGATLLAGRTELSATLNQPDSSVQVRERALGSGWGLRTSLTASAPGAGGFGQAIAIGNNFMAVGEVGDDEVATDSGAVEVYVRDSKLTRDWRPFGRVKASDAATDMEFGAAVATDSNLLVVGAPGKNSDRGAVYIFKRADAVPSTGIYTWRQLAVINGPVAGSRFGAAVALNRANEWKSGSALDLRILIGAPLDNVAAATTTGRVYLFRPTVPTNLSAWSQAFNYTGSDSGDNSMFGSALAFEGDTFAVGAWIQAGGGAVYMFRDNGASGWVQTKKVTASDTSRGPIGLSISLSQDRLAVGTAPPLIFPNSGGAFIFERHRGGTNQWGEVKKILPPSDQVSWGLRVALDGDSLLIGSPVQNDAGSRSGAVSVRRWNQGGENGWGEVRKLLAADARADDTFGSAVAMNLSAVAIGAPGSDSRGADTGAVYTYRFGSYEFWVGNEGLPPGQDGPEQDPDEDGQPNLVEFALGADPRDGSSVGRFNYELVEDGGDKWLQTTWFKPSYPLEEVQATFRGSDSLGGFGDYLRIISDNPLVMTTRAYYPVRTRPKYFTRMEVVYPYTIR